jgi:transposase
VDTGAYLECILPFFDEYFEKNPTKMLVEDNARPHTAEACERAKNLRSWIRIEWPPNSPDLNPMENVWRVLKQKIYQGKNPRPRRIGELREAIQKAWNELTNEEVISFIESMPWRIHECLKANGGMTRW